MLWAFLVPSSFCSCSFPTLRAGGGRTHADTGSASARETWAVEQAILLNTSLPKEAEAGSSEMDGKSLGARWLSVSCLLCLEQKGWEAFPPGDGSRVSAGKCGETSAQPWAAWAEGNPPALPECSGGSLLLHKQGHPVEFSDLCRQQCKGLRDFCRSCCTLTPVKSFPRVTAGSLNTHPSNGQGTAWRL